MSSTLIPSTEIIFPPHPLYTPSLFHLEAGSPSTCNRLKEQNVSENPAMVETQLINSDQASDVNRSSLFWSSRVFGLLIDYFQQIGRIACNIVGKVTVARGYIFRTTSLLGVPLGASQLNVRDSSTDAKK